MSNMIHYEVLLFKHSSTHPISGLHWYISYLFPCVLITFMERRKRAEVGKRSHYVHSYTYIPPYTVYTHSHYHKWTNWPRSSSLYIPLKRIENLYELELLRWKKHWNRCNYAPRDGKKIIFKVSYYKTNQIS